MSGERGWGRIFFLDCEVVVVRTGEMLVLVIVTDVFFFVRFDS